MRQRVQTLLTHVPTTSLGLRTSLVGRIIFVVAATTSSLTLLYQQPLAWHSQFFYVVAYGLGIIIFGAGRVLKRRPVQMLLLACTLIALVNSIWPVESARMDWNSRMSFGASRGLTYAALAYATLLVASITRPSDIARLASHFTANPRALCLIAIPFSTFTLLIGAFKDMLVAGSARLSRLSGVRKAHSLVIDVAAALLASTLTRSLHLYQTAYAFPQTEPSGRQKDLLSDSPLLSCPDLFFIALLSPGWMAGLMI